jgi:hypothetical protein
MGGVCSTHGGDKFIQNFSRKICKEETSWEISRRLVANFQITLKELEYECVNWIHLAQNRADCGF